MLNLKNEISRVPPMNTPHREYYGIGVPIFYVFNCALLERESEKGFVYTAVNYSSGRSEVMSKRLTPLAPREVEKMAERIITPALNSRQLYI